MSDTGPRGHSLKYSSHAQFVIGAELSTNIIKQQYTVYDYDD